MRSSPAHARDAEYIGGVEALEETAARRLDRWKLSLLDLTLRNRLLDAKDGRQVLPLAVDAVALAVALDGDAAFTLVPDLGPGGDPLARKELPVTLPSDELDRRLTAIARAARESLSEGGARTLWIGVGMLKWFDEGDPTVARHAPLVLIPVELRRAGQRYKVERLDDEDWRWNDTLVEKLKREHAIELAAPAGDDLDAAAGLAAATAALAGKPGWAVLPEARLGIFAFTKFVMWTDLAERGEALAAAPVVRHLLTGGGQAFPDQGAFPDPQVLDQAVPLAELFAPLDCDASQLAAVLAAAQGKSFVLQGPPGTGKSQTIANLIAQCLATGRTVLFVSEKIAALEVVHRRLAAVGLADFCLPLHSHRARKREVITELGRVLERTWRPAAAGGDDTRLEASRAALNAHVRALHTPGRAGVTVHDALARLGATAAGSAAAARLRDAPAVPGGEATAARSPAEVAAQREAAEHLAQAGAEVAPIGEHPWRGSTLTAWQVQSGDEVALAVAEVQAAVAELTTAVAALPGVVPGLTPRTRDELEAVGALAEVALASPRPGAELVFEAGGRPAGAAAGRRGEVALVKTSLEAAPRDINTWLMLERQGRALDRRLDERWTGKIYELDTGRLAETFRAWAGRFFLLRWFALRGPRRLVKQALARGPLPDDATLADDLDAADVVRKTDDLLDAARPAVRRWLGALAAAAEPDADLEPVERALAWVGELRAAFDRLGLDGAARDGAWRALVAAVSDGAGDGATVFADLARAVGRWRAALARVATVCGVDAAALGAGGDDGGQGHLAAVAARAAAWAAAPGALRDWAAYVRAREAARAVGLGELVTQLESGALAAADLVRAWEKAFLLGVASAGIAASPELSGFHGAAHHARVTEFAELDRAHLARARARAVARLAERVPRVDARGGDPADTGEVGVLLHEVKKQRRHKPLRALFREIPTLLTRLKPCLLMSPLSVAQYLDPTSEGLTRFDVVVFDEASQIPTADAIGALARGEAAVVVGDSRQLPPTRFFTPGEGAPAGDEDDDVDELESVLDECVAARLPELRLTWHYRSRHEDLIAFSNEHYYDGGLDVFPAPAARTGELGVAWRKIDGVYDRAGTRTNRAEAEAVVAEIVARLLDGDKARKSLGVVTFSKPQQELVLDLLDDAIRGRPELERFFAAEPTDDVPEPVLVKNLETIQGDERDVILFSIGYGPDAAGKVAMNFGPLNRDGGERRLNVAITRAREQLVVFSSLEPEAIGEDVAARGVRDLRGLLAYARAGGGVAGRGAEPPATEVTAAIAAALEARGLTVHHRVGCAGYRIDLAVVDPDDPGRYVLGIETDGPAYARAATARDRDRLRALVLGNLGWRLHRIWVLDWWHDADKELQRLSSAVMTAIAAARQARNPRPARSSAPPPATTSRAADGSGPRPIARAPSAPVTAPVPRAVTATGSPPARTSRPSTAPPAAAGERAPAVAPYKAASVPPGRWTQDDFYDRGRDGDLGKTIDAVLAVEAPVHLSLLSRRVGAYFGVGRVTARVIERVRELADARARVGADGDPDVVWRRDQDPTAWPTVRVPAQAPETRRDLDELPLAEIAAAALIVLHRNLGLPAADLHRETAKLLGFARQGEKVIARMADGVATLVAKGLANVDGDRVTLV